MKDIKSVKNIFIILTVGTHKIIFEEDNQENYLTANCKVNCIMNHIHKFKNSLRDVYSPLNLPLFYIQGYVYYKYILRVLLVLFYFLETTKFWFILYVYKYKLLSMRVMPFKLINNWYINKTNTGFSLLCADLFSIILFFLRRSFD